MTCKQRFCGCLPLTTGVSLVALVLFCCQLSAAPALFVLVALRLQAAPELRISGKSLVMVTLVATVCIVGAVSTGLLLAGVHINRRQLFLPGMIWHGLLLAMAGVAAFTITFVGIVTQRVGWVLSGFGGLLAAVPLVAWCLAVVRLYHNMAETDNEERSVEVEERRQTVQEIRKGMERRRLEALGKPPWRPLPNTQW